MTELLFLTDSYLKSFKAVVSEVVDNGVILDKTAFYPLGGGQPSDRGTIYVANKSFPVTKVVKSGPNVMHIVEGELPSPGATVRGEIDWDYRYEKMRLHTAIHILCGMLYHNYTHYGAEEPVLVSGGEIYADKPGARIDFTLPALTKDLAMRITEDANTTINKGGAVKIDFLSREEAEKIPELIRTKVNLLPKSVTEIRTVEIEELDIQFDGGTHVRNIGEIGVIKLVKTDNKGKGRKRLKIALA
ncbi:MAG: alanyl-tRNA editing protein [Candidatus Hodarchaeales archaeon]|jgi:Ser-tRNA(Ala) deacylase AlaX